MFFLIKRYFSLCDVVKPFQLGIKDPASSGLEDIISFQSYFLFFLIIIGVGVVWVLVEFTIICNSGLINKLNDQKISNASRLKTLLLSVLCIAFLLHALLITNVCCEGIGEGGYNIPLASAFFVCGGSVCLYFYRRKDTNIQFQPDGDTNMKFAAPRAIIPQRYPCINPENGLFQRGRAHLPRSAQKKLLKRDERYFANNELQSRLKHVNQSFTTNNLEHADQGFLLYQQNRSFSGFLTELVEFLFR